MSERVLYVIVCGAGPAPYVDRLVKQAHDKGWTVCLIATPSGREFLDVPALEELTGRPVRSQYGEPAKLPHADAVIVAPATYNTINKWAAGIADTFALGLLAELTGMGVPIAVLPFVNTAYAANKVFAQSVTALRDAGVTVLYGPGAFEPHPPGTGGTRLESYPWHLALNAVTTS